MVIFKHSGALGDIIMSLPSIRSLAKDDQIKLFLQVDLPDQIPAFAGLRYPVRLPADHAQQLIPLLKSQGIDAALWQGEAVGLDYDLDLFRKSGFDFGRGDIARFVSYYYHEAVPDLSRPWIEVEPDKNYKDKVVINRTERYHRPLDYSFLDKRSDCVFVGLADEHLAFRQMCPDIEHVKVADHHALARIIRGAKLYLGNQSFCWTLAQATDAKRVLEIYPQAPIAAPTSTRGRDAWTQAAFEWHVKDLLGE